MNSQPTYEQFITESVKELPQEALAEVARFVLFLRQRIAHPQSFEAELQIALIEQELLTLQQAERAHLDQEFADYDQQYPLEF